MRLSEDHHLHEFDGVGSNSVVAGLEKSGDDLLDGADHVPDGLHIIRDHLGLGQPTQRHFIQMRHGLDDPLVHGHGPVRHHHLQIGDHLGKIQFKLNCIEIKFQIALKLNPASIHSFFRRN